MKDQGPSGEEVITRLRAYCDVGLLWPSLGLWFGFLGGRRCGCLMELSARRLLVRAIESCAAFSRVKVIAGPRFRRAFTLFVELTDGPVFFT